MEYILGVLLLESKQMACHGIW